jgi:hypothetical protein
LSECFFLILVADILALSAGTIRNLKDGGSGKSRRPDRLPCSMQIRYPDRFLSRSFFQPGTATGDILSRNRHGHEFAS